GVTTLYGNMWKPFDFDPNRKYPIIAHVYPGPQQEGVTHSFSAYSSNMQLAQLGFIVIQVGHRGGTPARSKAYHSHGYFNLRDYALADKKAAIEQLAARYPFIDLERVGIYGHSGGGFLSAAALLQKPYNEFFKVAVASAGNHDNNIYNDNWAERYHGLKEVPIDPKDDKDSASGSQGIPPAKPFDDDPDDAKGTAKNAGEQSDVVKSEIKKASVDQTNAKTTEAKTTDSQAEVKNEYAQQSDDKKAAIRKNTVGMNGVGTNAVGTNGFGTKTTGKNAVGKNAEETAGKQATEAGKIDANKGLDKPPDGFRSDDKKTHGAQNDGQKTHGAQSDGKKTMGTKSDGSKIHDMKGDGNKIEGSKDDSSKFDGTKGDSSKIDGSKGDVRKGDGKSDVQKAGVKTGGASKEEVKKADLKGETKKGEVATSEAPKTRFEIKVPTNAELAANLKGHLLLVHGEMDDNVHPANTMRLVDALIKANKRFDMLILPGKRHGFGDYQPYFTQRMWDYFAEHLLQDRQTAADLYHRTPGRK
ncbi:MAG: S9 family peptidase, partial [Nitrospira sp.]|nr:S9 family peptidase [Nitrospira sp.]